MMDIPEVGEFAQNEYTYTTEIVKQFIQISGDNNPIHLDIEFAKNTVFQKPIVHGMLVASQISSLIASKLPGPGSIYLHQELNFKAPVYHNETIVCRIEVTAVNKDKGIIYLDTECFNNQERVITGKAIIKK